MFDADVVSSHHEMVVVCNDEKADLKAIIAIHDTTLGRGMGGCRMADYPSEAAALQDVLRLSEGMTRKYAAAGLPYGGAKAVIIADPARVKSRPLLEAFAKFVERLAGEYVTAEDAGTTTSDMRIIAETTAYVRNLPLDDDREGSFCTAYGVYQAMLATLAASRGDGVRGIQVAIQGLGKVGMALAGILHEAGAKLIAADKDAGAAREARERFGANIVDPDMIYQVPSDVFSPCALGGVLDESHVSTLAAKAVVGAANNQLARPEIGKRLHERGTLYCPDFIANAGGVLAVAAQGTRYERDAALRRVTGIGATAAAIFKTAAQLGIPPSIAADQLVERRIAEGRCRSAEHR